MHMHMPNLALKITNKVAYKAVLKAQNDVVLKAESMVEKAECLKKLRNVIGTKIKSVDEVN